MFKRSFAAFALAAAAAVSIPSVVTAQLNPSPTPSATPSPMPSETAPPSPLPSATPTPTPTATASPTASPLPTATPLPTPLVLPQNAPPQILAVAISDPVFHSGETVSGTVITSTNVVAVELRLEGHSVRLPRANYGVFQMTYTMPHIPFFFRRTYTAQVVALTDTGLQAERDVTISVR